MLQCNGGLASLGEPAQRPKHVALLCYFSLKGEMQACHGVLDLCLGEASLCLQILYWKDRQDLPQGQAVMEAIDTMVQPCQELAAASIPIPQAHNHIDTISHALSQLWDARVGQQPAYSEQRMHHMMQLTSNALVNFCQRALSSPEQGTFWEHDNVTARSNLSAALALLHAWQRHVDQLMTDWIPGPESISQHAWQYERFANSRMQAFAERLERIIGFIELQAEMLAAVSAEQEGSVRMAFTPLQDVNSLQVTKLASDRWAASAARVEAALAPLEGSIAAQLRADVTRTLLPALAAALLVQGDRSTGAANGAAQPYQVFQQLLKRRRLLARPAVLSTLSREQVTLAGMVSTYLEQIRSSATSMADIGSNAAEGAVAAIVWMRQHRHKVETACQTLRAFAANDAAPSDKAQQAGSDATALMQRLAVLEKVRPPYMPLTPCSSPVCGLPCIQNSLDGCLRLCQNLSGLSAVWSLKQPMKVDFARRSATTPGLHMCARRCAVCKAGRPHACLSVRSQLAGGSKRTLTASL